MTQTVVCLSVALAHNGDDDDKGRNEEKRGRADGGQSHCLRVVRELSTTLHWVSMSMGMRLGDSRATIYSKLP